MKSQSDLHNAHLFAERYASTLRYLPTLGWFQWNGQCWQPIDHDMLLHLAASILSDPAPPPSEHPHKPGYSPSLLPHLKAIINLTRCQPVLRAPCTRNDYVQWCERRHLPLMTETSFGRKIVQRGFQRVRSSSCNSYRGISIFQQLLATKLADCSATTNIQQNVNSQYNFKQGGQKRCRVGAGLVQGWCRVNAGLMQG